MKVPRPDNVPEELGLTVIDEPTSKGVDKYILEMELAENTKAKIDRINVKSIQNAEKKPNEITDWINKVDDLQKRKVPTEVNYSKNMPDIQNLMDVWPEKEEQVYKKIEFIFIYKIRKILRLNKKNDMVYLFIVEEINFLL